MKRLIKSGIIEEVIFARLEPGEDVLLALYDICIEKDIKSGIILDGSGSVVNFTYQHMPKNPKLIPTSVTIGTMEGRAEFSLHGTIGTAAYNPEDGKTPEEIAEVYLPTIPGVLDTAMDKWRWSATMNGPGTPYVHAHCVASNKDFTVCGHLMPGTKVASGDPAKNKPSHFTVIIAKVSGLELQQTYDYKLGSYHNLISTN